MKNIKQIVISILIMFLIILALGLVSFVNAASAGPIYLGIVSLRSSGYGYQQSGGKVWKIAEYDSQTAKTYNLNRTIYCIKGGPGFGSSDMSTGGIPTISKYSQKFNLKDLSSIPSTYSKILPTGSNYNSLMWLLDNIYIMPKVGTDNTTAREAFLKSKIPNEYYEYITDDDIDVVQQLAIWYFTNPDGAYHFETTNLTVNSIANADSNYASIEDIWGDDGWDRANAIEALFQYYITNAKANSNYKSENNTNAPIEIDKSNAQMSTLDELYIAGPYKIIQKLDVDYEINAIFTDMNGNAIESAIAVQDSDGNVTVTEKPLKELVGKEIYFAMPMSSSASGIKMTINSSYTTKTLDYWSVADAPTTEQPVIILDETKQNFSDTTSMVVPKPFDLSLRKFITNVNGTEITNRIPQVDVSKLAAGESTTATYNHPKTPVSVTIGDVVTYTIRVYNEGSTDGYVEEITDHLPAQLEFLPDDSVNKTYGWTVDSSDSKTVRTSYLSKQKSTNNKITAFDGSTLSYKDVKIKCKVISTTPMPTKITNIAEITNFTDGDGNTVTDRDSEANNVDLPIDSDWEIYKDSEINRGEEYIPGQEDDDDFEKLILKEFDLSLRKFITNLNGTDITNRIPNVDISPLNNGATTANYKHTKSPMSVTIGDIVTYTIRVYNEGEIDGYVQEITDHLPDQLEFIADNATNKQYGWHVDGNNSKIIKTSYLSKENSASNKINAFDGKTLDYKDVKVVCKVISTNPMPTKITNIAEISDFVNSNGEKVTDRDSQEDNVNMPSDLPNYKDDEIEKTYVPGQQDDDDFEKLKIKEFDLALRKYITKLNDEDISNRIPTPDVKKLVAGTDTTATYNHTKTPINVTIGDVVEYTIRVYNEGEVDGYAQEITDHLPEQLEFVANNATNIKYDWKVDGNNSKTIKTSYLSKESSTSNKISAFNGTTLDYKEVKVVCKVVSTSQMPAKITNIAEISNFVNGNGEKVTDRDSQAENADIPSDLPSYKDGEITKDYVPGQQDDDDFEKLKIKEFDLALRKFITKVNDESNNSRIPVVDITKLKNGTDTTATYEHTKKPVNVKLDDIVEYTIRVYNEGGVDGYAEEITDHLPDQLEFVADNATNQKYGWTVDGANSKIIKTKYLSKENEKVSGENKILAFDGTTLAYKEVKVVCKVVETDPMPTKITNIAEISDFVNGNGEKVTDRDSQENNVNMPSDLPGYKDDEISKDYVPGQQDDDDFEKLVVKPLEFDLSLRKFITKLNSEEITSRIPTVDVSKLVDGSSTTATYNHPKTPVEVEIGDVVEYTIRVYNEAEDDGYVEEITDHLPDQLEFIVDNETNKKYGWTVDGANSKVIKTSYLSKANESSTGSNKIAAFNGKTLNYKDVKVVCKVILTNSMPEKITNIADITKFTNGNGKTVTDRDSQENNVNMPSDLPGYKDDEITKNYVPGQQDDDDFEKLKVKDFDLALRKFITKINDSDITSRIPTVDISKLADGSATTATYNHSKTPLKVTEGAIVEYTIRVYNEAKSDGYAEEITDHLPDQLEFIVDNETNKKYGWTVDSNNSKIIKTSYLSKANEKIAGENKIKAFDGTILSYKEVKVACKVVETDPMPTKITNIAEISDFTNGNGEKVTDRDSQENNVNMPSDLPGYKDDEIGKDYVPGQQDDDDFEKLEVKPLEFDLSLRKFITKINNNDITSRIPNVDVSKLVSGEETTATYNHPKTPVEVEIGDIVEYTIRVYNEAEVDGYVEEITDHLPDQLEFITDNATNKKYGWTVDGTNSKIIRTDYLSKAKESTDGANKIKAFDGSKLDYKEVKVVCKVVLTSSMPEKITNIADITKFTNGNGKTVTDRDSQENNVNMPSDLPGYKDDEIEKNYVPGQQDDDDFEKLKVKDFDLALRKFITKINDNEISSRIPTVDISKLADGSATTATYNHSKTPVEVEIGDIVEYTIRVYNEAKSDGYAEEITDHLPDQLEFIVDNSTNKKYGWTVDGTNPKIIRTKYLSKKNETSEGANKIPAFDGKTLSYKEVKVACKVVETDPMPTKITNIAEISDSTNGNGEKVTDRDSQENNVNMPSDLPGYKDDEISKDYVPGQQDDDDFEKLKVKDFDLALRKFITKINDSEITSRIPNVDISKLADGSATTATYNHTKTPLKVTEGSIVEYTIRVYNEARSDGYAEEITDHLPDQLEFIVDNATNKKYGWTVDSNNSKIIKTKYLAKENETSKGSNKIPAFDGKTLSYKEVKVVCKVVATDPMPTKITNIAEISDFTNGNGEKVTDRDSQENNVNMPSDLPGYKDDEIGKDYVPGQQDDDDFEKLEVKPLEFDLSLRKFITKLNDEEITSRIPTVDVSKLVDGSSTTATYNHPKTPVEVEIGDIVEYTIRVYNEAEVDGYVEEITDHLPEQLEFIADNETNKKYGWTVDGANSKVIKTSYLSKANESSTGSNKIAAFNGKTLDYKDVKVVCKVILTNPMPEKITNIADITKFTNGNGKTVTDRDSQENNVNIPSDLPGYKDDEIGKDYVPGQQDDDDFEKLKVKDFDLALRKFITKINDSEITSRIPTVDVSKLADGSATTATYNHTKTPLKVTEDSIVEYTIRVYNEAKSDGYAEEITDHLPDQLEFIADNETNKKYGWTVDNTNSKVIRTSYLSKANEKIAGENKIKAFDGTTLSYKEVKVACKVVATDPMPTKITNIAEISDFTNGNGEKVTDRDSQENNVNIPSDLPGYKDDEISKDYVPGQQDDDDFEKLEVKPLEFDLSLRKFITKVNDENINSRVPDVDITQLKNGTATTATYNHPKTPVEVEIGDIVEYTIRVYNEAEVDGYVEEITDHLPDQLEFIANNETNKKYGWTVDENNSKIIRTDYLSKAKESTGGANKIKAFDGSKLDYKEVKVVCKVVLTNSMPEKITNIADITKFTDGNGKTAKDRDSQENNVNMPSDLPSYKDDEITKNYVPGQQDDDDFEKLKVKDFDLALRKFITKINDSEITSRIPNVDISKLADGSATTATYNHTKTPIKVTEGSIVEYTIRVYNEAKSDGYAEEITDHLPDQLEFIVDNEKNKKYGWTVDSNNSKIIKTKYLAKENETSKGTNKISAFDGKTLSYKEVKVVCKVVATDPMPTKITNIAEISDFTNGNGEKVTDRDSQENNVNMPSDLPGYKDDEISKDYVPGQQDDDDFEKLEVKPLEFDLSLRKFITKLNNEEITSRIPQPDVSKLADGSATTATYNHPKTPVEVEIGDIVEYTIRVYNEAEVDGYVEEITDHLPEQLEFIADNETNKKYGWTVDGANLKVIKTSYLSKANESSTGSNKIAAFNGKTLDYKDVKVVCKVILTNPMPEKITNIADITKFTNGDGKTVTDRDSQENNVNIPSDLPGYKDDEIGKDYVPGQQDDDDFEKLKIKELDLALRKFITKVDDTEIKSRIPQVDTTPLKNGTGTTAIYNHSKEPVKVSLGAIVEYTIRVYNEGQVDGYAEEIKDHLPDQLEFIEDNETNKKYGWVVDSTDSKVIKTSYLSKENEKVAGENKIPAFDGTTLSYKEVKVACKVVSTDPMPSKITNLADVSDFTDGDGNKVTDRDSKEDNVKIPEDRPGYKDDESNKDYVPGQEDDDDFEKVTVAKFDLSLRKFITAVNDTEITSRIPQVDVTPIKDGSSTTAKYDHPKDPVLVSNGNIVTYTIRVYNEGEIDGYASEIKDDMPQGLKFLTDNETNIEYRWKMLDKDGKETENLDEAVSIVTDYLSKEQEKTAGANLLKAFDGEKLDYRDVKVAFEVTEPNTSDRILINQAQISKNTNKDGKDVKDQDSVPDKWNEGEDDQDIEKVKVQYFDLSLRKWVTQAIVTENGEDKIIESGHKAEDDPEDVVKVDLKKSKINSVTIKFRYKIRVKNEGNIAGYAKELKDYIPDGLKFVAEDNPLWKQIDEKTITTDQTKDILLQPGDTTEVEVLLTWINDSENFGVMDNWAEISKDHNDFNSPDIDSTPDNNKKGEDDIDDAPVSVGVQTGQIRTFTTIGLAVLAILSSGVVLIKKFVL